MLHPLKIRAKKTDDILFILWGGGGVLIAYFLVYALRKSFTAATFDGYLLWGLDFKVIISISQIIGYLIAKFLGIKFVSELKKNHRLPAMIISATAAECSLILFGLIPFPYNFFCLFLNGLSLGCMWGFLFAYIEGRKQTDILASFLGVSIIISSGAAKSFGLYFLTLDIDPFWMPALIGAIALPLFITVGFLLNKLPDPTEKDIQQKSRRAPLNGTQRINLLRNYAPLLIPLLLINVLFTVLRDVKEDFLVDIIDQTNLNLTPFLFIRIDSIVTIVLLLLLGGMILIKKNKTAIQILLVIMLTGSALIFISSLFFSQLIEEPVLWLFLQSIGIYSTYLAFQTIFFDRFIACFKIIGNVGFFIYLADFLGYLVSCIFLFYKSAIAIRINWLEYYNLLAIAISLISIVSVYIAFRVMKKRYSVITQ